MLSALASSRRRLVGIVAVAALSLTAVACDDDPASPEEEPEVQTVTLTVGTSSITIDKTTGAASGTLMIPATASTITAQWKKADGTVESLVTSAEFDLKIVPTVSAKLTYAAISAFS